MESILRGRAWVCGDYTGALSILPEAYWQGGAKVGSLNAEELGKYAMSGVDPDFARQALEGRYAFIVAGRNFGGGGKSIEHPIFAIKGAGIKAVVAESSSRYFFRNAINNGLPLLICEGITAQVKTDDQLEVDLIRGEIRNLGSGARLQTPPLPESVIDIVRAGGYLQHLKQKGLRP